MDVSRIGRVADIEEARPGPVIEEPSRPIPYPTGNVIPLGDRLRPVISEREGSETWKGAGQSIAWAARTGQDRSLSFN